MIELTNGAQVADTAIIAHVTAEIDGGYVRDRVTVTQYDDNMPVVAVSLMYQNQPYAPPDGAALNVRMRKTDGKGVYNPCLGADADGVVYLAITQQMTAVHGNSTFTVEVSVDGGVKNTPPIGIAINPNPVQEGQIESEDEFLTLQEILAQCQKYGQLVESNAANIQTVVDEMDAIKDAPAAAERAEAAAAEAEKSAAESKGFRTFHGAVVPDASGNLDPSRPMTVGPAASVEIESAGNRIESVTALGFTKQTGSGTPSPENQMPLTNGGLRLMEVTFDGSSDENWTINTGSSVGVGGSKRFSIETNYTFANTQSSTTTIAYCSDLNQATPSQTYGTGYDNTFSVQNKNIQPRFEGISTVEALRNKLQKRPVTFWILPASESDATGLYTPIILTSGEYRATCLEPTAPLCEGDSVVSWVKSGCDKQVTLGASTVFVLDGANTFRTGLQTPAASGKIEYSNAYPWSGAGASAGNRFNIAANSQALYVIDTNFSTAEEFNAHITALEAAGTPVTIWYRSTNYTEATDIPVSLETHQMAVLVLDGTENVILASGGHMQVKFPESAQAPVGGADSSNVCSHAKFVYSASGNGFYLLKPDASVIFGSAYVQAAGWSSAEDCKAYIAAQYAAGTPVTIVYQLATPITYAHPAVVLEAATGDQLTYTVTGQSGGTVSVALKPFQDGGNAKQLDGHAWSEVPGQAPVQSVNGKTGKVTLAAADVGALPAAGTAQKANALVGGGVGTQYTFGAYEMQCHNNSEIPNAYSLKSIFRSDANYHLQVYSKADSSMQKTYCDFAGAVSGSSSIRFKADVRPVNGNVLDALLALDVIDFVYNDKAPDYSQDGLRHFGLIAEQVAKVLPNVVKMDAEGLPAAVVYSDLIPLLLAILQRQQKQIDELREKLEEA